MSSVLLLVPVRTILYAVAVSLLLAGGTAFAAGPPSVEAGVARVNLPPPLEMQAALGGCGERMSKPAVGVHDAVWAKAVVLTQGGRKFALVTADVLGFPPLFKAAVMERLTPDGWGSDQVLLLPSHSHTSLDLMALHPGNIFTNLQAGLFHKELFELTANRLAQVIREAGKAPLPILAGSTTVAVPDRNRNRRSGNSAHDSNLTITRIDAGNSRPLAVLVNWTAHPTFMDAEDMLFSGDWPGHLQRTVEALIGSPRSSAKRAKLRFQSWPARPQLPFLIGTAIAVPATART